MVALKYAIQYYPSANSAQVTGWKDNLKELEETGTLVIK